MKTTPRLALGTVQIGLPYGIANRSGQPVAQEAGCILDAAWEVGVRTWDTAPAYGVSEAVIGAYLRGRGVRPRIVTKLPSVRKSLGENASRSDIQTFVRASLSSSLERLRSDHIWGYLLHDENDVDLAEGAVLDALRSLVAEGQIHRFGVSSYDTRVADFAVAQDDVSLLQVPFNLVDHRFEEAIRKVETRGGSAFVRSPFLQGLFFLTPERAEAELGVGEAVGRIQRLAENEGLSVAALALAYSRERSGASYVLAGAESADQVRDGAEGFRAPLPHDVAGEVAAIAAQFPTPILDPSRWDAVRLNAGIETSTSPRP